MILIGLILALQCGPLVEADQKLTEAIQRDGLLTALPAALAADGVLLFDAAPVLTGRDVIAEFLKRQSDLAGYHFVLQPFRAVLSSTNDFGVTFGALATYRSSDGKLAVGRYINAWRCDADSAWRLVAHTPVGGYNIGEPRMSMSERAARLSAVPAAHDEFARADLAFSDAAGARGAPAAFEEFAAPNAITFAGTGELNIGPAKIRERLAKSPVAAAKWQWHPVWSMGSGDLGVTVGEAVIGSDNNVFYSKYLTVWQRQANGAVRFIVDGGNSRPARER